MSPVLPPSPESLDLPDDAVVALTGEDELVLHRLVRDDPPDLTAFVSKLVRGGRRFPAERPILHAGLSMFATVDQAVSRARRIPKIVAAVRISGPDIHVAKTLGAGHYTVWGEAADLCERASIVHHES
jgi:hypothetical protein